MRDRLAALRALHPFPSLLVAAVTAGIVPLADRSAPASRYLTLGGAMLLYQFAIGLVNDVVDAPEDRRSKPWKPIARGIVPRRLALALAAVCAVAAMLITLHLPLVAWMIGGVGLATGVAYDVYLKRTPFSWLPYAVGLPLVPLWVHAASGTWRPVLWWTLPLGALLGLALQLANQAPDVASGDRAGLPGRLGERASRVAALVLFAADVGAVALVLLAASPARAWLAAGVGAVAIAVSPWSTRIFGRDGLFGLLAAASALLAVLFLSTV